MLALQRQSAPISHAVEANDLLFLSGQVPVDPATGMLAPDSIGEQTTQCFKNLFAVLESAGLTPDAVVSVNVYLTDMGDFQGMNEVYAKHFSKLYPARTTVGVASLPRGVTIEIALTARKHH